MTSHHHRPCRPKDRSALCAGLALLVLACGAALPPSAAAPAAQITGKVTLGGNRTPPPFVVRVLSLSSGRQVAGRSFRNPSGEYTLEGIPPGEYKLEAKSGRSYRGTVPRRQIIDGGNVVNFFLEVASVTGTIRGVAAKPDGTILASTEVALGIPGCEGCELERTITNEHGEYSFKDVAAEDYQLTVELGGASLVAGVVAVREGRDLPVRLEVREGAQGLTAVAHLDDATAPKTSPDQTPFFKRPPSEVAAAYNQTPDIVQLQRYSNNFVLEPDPTTDIGIIKFKRFKSATANVTNTFHFSTLPSVLYQARATHDFPLTRIFLEQELGAQSVYLASSAASCEDSLNYTRRLLYRTVAGDSPASLQVLSPDTYSVADFSFQRRSAHLSPASLVTLDSCVSGTGSLTFNALGQVALLNQPKFRQTTGGRVAIIHFASHGHFDTTGPEIQPTRPSPQPATSTEKFASNLRRSPDFLTGTVVSREAGPLMAGAPFMKSFPPVSFIQPGAAREIDLRPWGGTSLAAYAPLFGDIASRDRLQLQLRLNAYLPEAAARGFFQRDAVGFNFNQPLVLQVGIRPKPISLQPRSVTLGMRFEF